MCACVYWVSDFLVAPLSSAPGEVRYWRWAANLCCINLRPILSANQSEGLCGHPVSVRVWPLHITRPVILVFCHSYLLSVYMTIYFTVIATKNNTLLLLEMTFMSSVYTLVCSCYSYVGRQQNGQVVSLNRNGCVHLSVVQHELLHALGFRHEHSRSDRDSHVQILTQNILPG